MTREAKLANPFTIMLEIARVCYLEDILFGKADSLARSEVSQWVESADRLSARELAETVNAHMAQRMFLVGESVSAADVVVFAALAQLFSQELQGYEKFALPHAFRWLDHVQHLPGMLEQVSAKNLLTAFPNAATDAEGPSKSQLKKLAKQ